MKLDKMTNENIREVTVRAGEISRKAQERRLQQYRYVMQRSMEYVGKKVLNMGVKGR